MLFFYPKKVAKRLGDRGYHAAEIVPPAEGIHRSSHLFNLAKSVQSFNKPRAITGLLPLPLVYFGTALQHLNNTMMLNEAQRISRRLSPYLAYCLPDPQGKGRILWNNRTVERVSDSTTDCRICASQAAGWHRYSMAPGHQRPRPDIAAWQKRGRAATIAGERRDPVRRRRDRYEEVWLEGKILSLPAEMLSTRAHQPGKSFKKSPCATSDRGFALMPSSKRIIAKEPTCSSGHSRPRPSGKSRRLRQDRLR